jgi:hypothetical protein
VIKVALRNLVLCSRSSTSLQARRELMGQFEAVGLQQAGMHAAVGGTGLEARSVGLPFPFWYFEIERAKVPR